MKHLILIVMVLAALSGCSTMKAESYCEEHPGLYPSHEQCVEARADYYRQRSLQIQQSQTMFMMRQKMLSQ